ncbi:hypothetical protein ANN_14197 [Periplaneta americana]|uniref:Uncharacterized protein n=1 Tax=Periplaneta americana TaxID=6978 RepID=A0ABQ8SWV3_PERAM|nr:hypothetical protein ANN_14197 [Periplaneta americana]
MAGLCEGGNEPPGSLKASKPAKYCIGHRVLDETSFVSDRLILNKTVSVFLELSTVSNSSPRPWSQATKGKTLEERDLIRYCGLNFDVAQWLEHLNQSDSLMAADGDCHHLCMLMAPVRHRWSISDSIGEIRNIVMPSDCLALRFGIRSLRRSMDGVKLRGEFCLPVR